MFDFSKKNQLGDEMAKSIAAFNKLLDIDIRDIWSIENQVEFLTAMNGWICKKCAYGDN